MKKLTLWILSFAIAACLSTEVFAQNDSSWLDAGTLKLKRDFTQTISIKGEDLEKMPFANLAEAIDMWLYGAYSNPTTLLYVVDGVPLGDVNGYSIYDIEEIIFVQNALAQVNGVSGQQQLVLIRTKRKGPGGAGVTVAAQSGLANRNFSALYPGQHMRSNTDWYEQYYAGLNRNTKQLDFGISADYLRDVLPSVKADSINTTTPFNLQRYRLNGYLNIHLGKRNEIALHVNYTSQNMDSAQHFFESGFNNAHPYIYQSTRQHQTQFTPWLKWHSAFGKGWNNDFEFAWLTSVNKANDLQNQVDSLFSPPTSYNTQGTGYHHTEHIFIREHLSYTAQAGAWSIVPSLNGSYEHLQAVDSGTITTQAGIGGSISAQASEFNLAAKFYFLSPSLNINYRDALGIQGGLLVNLTKSSGSLPPGDSRIFPFASLCTDFLKWRNPENRSSLKLFGSVAAAPNWNTRDFTLVDPAGGNGIVAGSPGTSGVYGNYGYNSYSFGGSLFEGMLSLPAKTSYWGWSAGLALSTPDDRWQISYNLEKRYCYIQPLTASLNGQPYSFFYSFYPLDLAYSTHYLGIRMKMLSGKGLNWQSGLNITTMSAQAPAPFIFFIKGIAGNLNSDRISCTGGWVNRFQYHDLSWGVDLAYHFNGLIPGLTNPFPKINTLLVQNIYLAYRLRLRELKSLELYLDSRNLFQSSLSDPSDLSDGRRFYGIGGKIGI